MLKRLGAIFAIGALAACQPEAPTPSGLSNYAIDGGDLARVQCTMDGGRWAKGGADGGYLCLRVPKDAGQSCKKSTDCSTNICLARSRSCAPVAPLFGCNEILTRTGRVATMCLE
ncbi:hypothetical protein ACP2AV_04220 [Aliiroseovarius sp. PTFE2010]|uniref:hypothetical protein n=1 Tax=Aliiroseovarius sp. PTFE2010 TaxID=3417190 RepID=UPI003CF7B72E